MTQVVTVQRVRSFRGAPRNALKRYVVTGYVKNTHRGQILPNRNP